MSVFDKGDGKALEILGVFVGVVLTLMVVFMTIAPFFIDGIPQTNQRVIDQQQTMLQTVFIALVSFLWGTSVGQRQKDQTISTLSRTTSDMNIASSKAGSPDHLSLKPGETASTSSKFDGVEIVKDPALSADEELQVNILIKSEGLTRTEAIRKVQGPST